MLRVFESFAGIGTQRMGLERGNAIVVDILAAIFVQLFMVKEIEG